MRTLGISLQWLALALASAMAQGQQAVEGSVQPPNVILLVVDDMGWRDAGFMGSQFYSTPHMDALAQEGVVFNAAYSAGPNCAPSRASLQTGRYTPRHGILTVGNQRRGKRERRSLRVPDSLTVLAEEEITLGEIFTEAGFATGHVGKWHLGKDPRTQGYAFNYGGGKWGHPPAGYHMPLKLPGTEDAREDAYLTELEGDAALEFIRENQHRPFFLHLAHYAVHTPIQPPKGGAAAFKNRPEDQGQKNAGYAAMLASVDQQLGRIRSLLSELDLRQRTLLILTSDNGGHGGVTSMLPLAGWKGTLREGGIRVPLVFCQPGRLGVDQRRSEPVHHVDLLPTLVGWWGIRGPGESVELDGQDLSGFLLGQGHLAERSLFWHFPRYLQGKSPDDPNWRTTPCSVLRRGRWKLVEFYEDGRRTLHDLEADMGESKDLSETHPDEVRSMARELDTWRKAIHAAMPQEIDS